MSEYGYAETIQRWQNIQEENQRKLEQDAGVYYSTRNPGTSYAMRGYSDTFITQSTPQDITQDALNILMPPIPPSNVKNVEWRHGCVVGWPGSGKTVLFSWIVKNVWVTYGAENVNTCYCNDLSIAIDRINAKPVQLMIIDDAARNANSLNMMDKENMDAQTIFQELRHEYERVSKNMYGVIICIFGWQRWMELRKSYRSGQVVIFKTAVSEKADQDWLINNLSKPWYKRLQRISNSIVRGNNKMKSLSVAYIPSAGIPGGVGFFRSGVPKDVKLEMLQRETYHFQRRPPASTQKNEIYLAPEWERKIHAKRLGEATGIEAEAAFMYHRVYIDQIPPSVLSFELECKEAEIEKLLKQYREALAYYHREEERR